MISGKYLTSDLSSQAVYCRMRLARGSWMTHAEATPDVVSTARKRLKGQCFALFYPIWELLRLIRDYVVRVK